MLELLVVTRGSAAISVAGLFALFSLTYLEPRWH
jgi:hypothetical protein